MLGPMYALLLLAGQPVSASSGPAPGSLAPAAVALPPYVSVSGATTIGFATGESIDSSRKVDVASILPAGSNVPGVAKPLVEMMWRESPTFRRQCARLAAARVAVTLSLDVSPGTDAINAKSEITHKRGLRAYIHLRGVDARAPEYLAHEIEHVLEQIDEVDLQLAVVARVHGARLGGRPNTFETSRAIAVGRMVAREIQDHRDRR
jgi:hypothetical protein